MTTAQTSILTGRRLHVVIGALMLTVMLSALDQTIVATALPTIVGELGGLTQLAWVVTSYLLAATASTPLWGKFSDLYGRKPMLISAVSVFLVGSALSGAAQTMSELIATRAVQGLGAGGLMVLSMAVIADVIPPSDRGRYQGLFGAVFGVASVLGPLVGGFFVENLSWRWIFYINLPLGALVLFVLATQLHLPRVRTPHRIDWFGAALLVAGVVALLLVTQWGGREYDWTSPLIIGLTLVGTVALAVFVWWERRAPEPIVPMTLFSNPIFSVSAVVGFLMGFAMFGAIVFLPVYLQVVRGSAPTQAGLELLPLMAGLLIMSVTSGRVISRIGRYRMFPIAGTLVAALGMYLLAQLQADSPYWQVALAMLVLGLGLGQVIQVLVLAVQNSSDPRQMGAATSGITFFRQMGGSFGTAAFGAVLAATLSTRLTEYVPAGAAEGIDPGALTGSPEVIAALPPEVRVAVETAFVDSLSQVFLFAIPICLAAFVFALFLKEVPLRTGDQMMAAGRAPADRPQESADA
jgi:EmrB/QacA subfamily drug resistance transporter